MYVLYNLRKYQERQKLYYNRRSRNLSNLTKHQRVYFQKQLGINFKPDIVKEKVGPT